MPKSNKTNSHKMDNVPNQDEASTKEDSSSEKKLTLRSLFIYPKHFQAFYAIYRGCQDGLDHECWSVFKMFEMEVEM